MRAVPMPIAVITSSYNTKGQGNDKAKAARETTLEKEDSDLDNALAVTLSSFTSVTLGPPPVVSFNLRRPSQTLDALLAKKVFRVHLIRGDNWGELVARSIIEKGHSTALKYIRTHFAHLNANDQSQVPPSSVRMLPLDSFGDQFNDHDVPLIYGKGILANLDCKVAKTVEIGDHTVVFAEVSNVYEHVPRTQTDIEGEREAQDCGLTYNDGDYTISGKRIDPKIGEPGFDR